MNSSDLQNRFNQFAYRVVKVCEELPQKKISSVIEHQVLRSSFSAAANYRAACKGISRKAFVAKLNIAFEEIDESLFWLERILDLELSCILSTKWNQLSKKLQNWQAYWHLQGRRLRQKLILNINY